MKKFAAVLALITLVVGGAFAQASKPPRVKLENLPDMGLRTVKHHAFAAGERVKYRMHYGFVNAGEAVLTVKDSPYKFGNREAYHVVGEGYSLGSFDWFFRVRDRYETYIDKEGLFPHRFIRNCDEGGYKIFQDYTFFPNKRAMKNHKEEAYMTPDFVQDMLSAYYYARTFDYSNAYVGQVFTVMTIVDDEIYPLKMKYMGKETVTVDAGTFSCLRFAPVVQKGRVFKKEEDLSVWITDDGNHLPVLAKAKILVGSVKMELAEYSGLANVVAKVN
ncbi:MAG: hypothetical protein RL220_743 [Bacteroidota bacterium]|jgi:hypothetical protein